MRSLVRGFKITGVGVGLPSNTKSNLDLKVNSPVNEIWTQEHLGIINRGVLLENETLSDLVFNATKSALKGSGNNTNPELIVVATGTPDYTNPSMAMILHQKLGLGDNVMAFDLQAVCNGFSYSLSSALSIADNAKLNSFLVVGADQFSKISDPNSRDVVYFGDGAGAVSLERDDSSKATFIFDHYAQGRNWADFKTSPGGYFEMIGSAVYETVKEKVPSAVFKLLKDCNLVVSDIDYFVTHQPSKVVLDMLEMELNIPKGRLVRDYVNNGNTASASVPIALNSIWDNYEKKSGTICFISFGAGWTWSVGLYNPLGL